MNIEIALTPLKRFGSAAAAFQQTADYLDGRLSMIALRIYGELQRTDALAGLALEALLLELLVEAANTRSNVEANAEGQG